MREAELLFLAAVLLYIYEGLFVLPTSTAVVQRVWRRWKRVDPLVLRGGRGPALALGALLPPLGPTVPVAVMGSHDVAAVTDAIALTVRATRHLRFAESLLFIAIFGGGAAMVWFDQAPDVPILLAIAWLWVLCVASSLDARREVPETQRPPWKDLIIACASPLSALRLHDLFFKRACPDADITAALLALAPPHVAREGLRLALAKARYSGDGPLPALETMAADWGYDAGMLDAEPERGGPEDLAFCPICLAAFSRVDARCNTCHDVAVRAFKTT